MRRCWRPRGLCLYVGAARADGLHEIRSLFERRICDELRISPATGVGDEVVCEGVAGPNLAAVALERLRAAGWEAPPHSVQIRKRIPVAAGLGGGSADAAAVLRLARGEVGDRRDRGGGRRRRALPLEPPLPRGGGRRADRARGPARPARGRAGAAGRRARDDRRLRGGGPADAAPGRIRELEVMRRALHRGRLGRLAAGLHRAPGQRPAAGGGGAAPADRGGARRAHGGGGRARDGDRLGPTAFGLFPDDEAAEEAAAALGPLAGVDRDRPPLRWGRMSGSRIDRKWLLRGGIALLVVAFLVFRDALPEFDLEDHRGPLGGSGRGPTCWWRCWRSSRRAPSWG